MQLSCLTQKGRCSHAKGACSCCCSAHLKPLVGRINSYSPFASIPLAQNPHACETISIEPPWRTRPVRIHAGLRRLHSVLMRPLMHTCNNPCDGCHLLIAAQPLMRKRCTDSAMDGRFADSYSRLSRRAWTLRSNQTFNPDLSAVSFAVTAFHHKSTLFCNICSSFCALS